MKYKIAITGAGKIAYSLTSALIKSGYEVDVIISRNTKSAGMLAKKFGIKHFGDNLLSIPQPVNIFFLSVPDSEIKTVANLLAKCNLDFPNSIFIHLSGAENISLLNVLKRKNAATASLHLMQTFPSKKIVTLKGVHAAIETENDKAYKFLFSLSKKLGLIPFKIKSSDKVYYHLAGVFASNFLAGNLYNSAKLFEKLNINEKESFEILSSTIYKTLDNVKHFGSASALSGPVDRGDLKTVSSHIKSLKNLSKKEKNGNYFKNLLKNYLNQSLNLLNLVEEKRGNLNKKHLAIKNLLVQELNEIEDSN